MDDESRAEFFARHKDKFEAARIDIYQNGRLAALQQEQTK
jgi:hypothetical protein